MKRYYILDGRDPVPATQEEWGKMFECYTARRVAETLFGNDGFVSTVFVGMNMAIGGGAPLLFETMIFHDGKDGEEIARYSTYDEAEAGHIAACLKIDPLYVPSFKHTKAPLDAEYYHDLIKAGDEIK